MKNDLESLGRLRLQAVLLLAAIFVIGALGGVAFERARQARLAAAPPGEPWRSGPPGRGLPPELRAELRLTADQERRIHAILEANRPRTDAILDQFLPRLRATVDSVRAEIRSVLTPEQQEIFDLRRPPLGPPLPGADPPPPLQPHRPPPGGPPHGPPPPGGRG